MPRQQWRLGVVFICAAGFYDHAAARGSTLPFHHTTTDNNKH